MTIMSERAADIDALIVSLSPEEMKALADRLASEVGYVLTAEPPHPDCPHQVAAESTDEAPEDLLAWFAQNLGLELSWGAEDEESDAFWRVHRRNGSVNDREWRPVAIGRTPAQAIANARAALATMEA